jgi:putative ABC transport system ATP-binding protein
VSGQPLSSAEMIRCRHLVHVFRTPGQEVAALRGVDLVVQAGEMVALLGPSGAGKTTLLWHLAGLLHPTAGTVEVAGQPVGKLSGAEQVRLRREHVGVVLQNPASNLLPYASAVSNVEFAMRASGGGGSGRQQRRRAHELLESVNLGAAAHRRAGRMSGGEQQRLAVAVALANSPHVLLADEPTSQLDPRSATAVLDVLASANRELGTTVVAVTHDDAVAEVFGRTVTIRDGRVGAEGRGGEEFMVVGDDGSLTLPPELLRHLPPGSLVRGTWRADAVELRRAR